MILINDGVGIINPRKDAKTLKADCIKYHEIAEDEKAKSDRRDRAYSACLDSQEELENLNSLLKIPFDVLIVIQREEEK